MTAPSQIQMFWRAHRQIADRHEAILDGLFGPNPLTAEEFERLIERRPEIYGQYRGLLETRRNQPKPEGV